MGSERDIRRACRQLYGGVIEYDTSVIFGNKGRAIKVGKKSVLDIAEVSPKNLNKYQRAGRTSLFINIGYICTSVIVDLSKFPGAKYSWINKYQPESLSLVVSQNDTDSSNVNERRMGRSCLSLEKQNGYKLVGINLEIYYGLINNREKPYAARLKPLYLRRK